MTGNWKNQEQATDIKNKETGIQSLEKTDRSPTSPSRQCLEKMLRAQANHNCATMVMLLLYKFYPDGSFVPGFSFNCSSSFNLRSKSNGISCTIDAISSRR